MSRLNARGKRIVAEITRKLAMLAIICFVISLWLGGVWLPIAGGIIMVAMIAIAIHATWQEFTLQSHNRRR